MRKLVVVVMLVIVVLLLFSVFSALANMPERKALEICQNNLRQLGLALEIYIGDYDDRLPLAQNWATAVYGVVACRDVFVCPKDRHPQFAGWIKDEDGKKHRLYTSYVYNRYLSGKESRKIRTWYIWLVEAEGVKSIYSTEEFPGSLTYIIKYDQNGKMHFVPHKIAYHPGLWKVYPRHSEEASVLLFNGATSRVATIESPLVAR